MTIPRLLATFTKDLSNISATSLQREINSSFWQVFFLLLLLEILFASKGFTAFQNFFYQ